MAELLKHNRFVGKAICKQTLLFVSFFFSSLNGKKAHLPVGQEQGGCLAGVKPRPGVDDLKPRPFLPLFLVQPDGEANTSAGGMAHGPHQEVDEHLPQ
jgi:hypothetical protein